MAAAATGIQAPKRRRTRKDESSSTGSDPEQMNDTALQNGSSSEAEHD